MAHVRQAKQLFKKFLSENKDKFRYKLDSGDDINLHAVLGSSDFKKIIEYAKGYDLIAIDEAQRIKGIGQGLKIMVDQAKPKSHCYGFILFRISRANW